MTELSDADRETAVKILAAWYGDRSRFAEATESAECAVKDNQRDCVDMLTTARTLITAEILAAAKVSECSCPNDAAYHAGAEAMRAAIIAAIDREVEYWDKRFGHGMLTYAEGLRIASQEAKHASIPTSRSTLASGSDSVGVTIST